MSLIFVYGTLKRGCKNHRHLAGQRFVTLARTAPGWALHNLGDYPGMVADPADRLGIAGELWEVDTTALAQLDRFEGVPEGLYQRTRLVLATPPDTAADAYIYLPDTAGHPRCGDAWTE